MLRRRALAVATGALATAALSLASVTHASAGPPPTAQDTTTARSTTAVTAPSPGMLKAMQRDLGLTAAQAKARLANEAEAAPVEKALRHDLAGSFAGSWTTGATARLVVATTDTREKGAISRTGAAAKVVEHSLKDLNAVQADLDKAAKRHAAPPLWYVDVRTNSVVVESAKPAEARKFIAASGADTDAVRVVKSDVRPRKLADVRGGDAYYMGSGGRCSVGFSVTRGSQAGFVTAGHCGTTGVTTRGYDQSAQGTFQGSSFPGNDYAWVAVNSNWTPRPWVKSGSSNVTVAGSQLAAVGASVCRSGSTTGWHCGTIRQHNTSVTYPEGTISGVTRTSVCAEPGDSGGSYISGNQAQGVTSGGSGNCSSGGETYFQPVNEILQTYGLTLTTGGGTTPPPTGCDNAQQQLTGTLAANGTAIQPGGSYYQSTVSGTHSGCLAGPTGTDFDLYLQKWNGSSWTTVAEGTTPAASETVTYNGTAGYYRYQVHAYSGSGTYTLGITKP